MVYKLALVQVQQQHNKSDNLNLNNSKLYLFRTLNFKLPVIISYFLDSP